MKSCNKVTFDVILAHKEHFDQKLIEIVQNLEKQNQALSAASARKDAKIQSLTHIMAAANKKIADMRCVNKTLQMEKKEADDLAKEFEEMLRRMQNELDEIKKENDANYAEIQKMRREAEKKQKRNRAPEKDHQQASGIQLNKFKYAFFRRYTFTYSSKRKKVHQFQKEEHAVQRRTERTSCSSFCAF
ncbi:hypothetical protein [Bulleidia sp. HCP3S3_F2]|uniref:hypothetical protein n=1 Tax=unclassified Bulleidia TaxID=2704656 RepID=UPI003F88CA47